MGDVLLRTGKTTLRLTNVLHVPSATENLLSVRHATKSGASFTFSSSGCRISKDGTTLVTAPCLGDNIYYLTGECKESSVAALLGKTTKADLPEANSQRVYDRMKSQLQQKISR